MAAAQDVEISLGTGRLLGLFFGFVAVCGIFFGLGYTLGHSVAPAGVAAASPAANADAAKSKPASGTAPDNAAPSTNDLTFYKTVEQKDANPQLAPPAPPATPAPTVTPPPSDTPHTSAYVVQVAAVSKKEDADALAGILRKKNYPVFLVSNAPGDSLFHVQVGPFSDIKDAEAMRGKLAGDGYSPIVKK